MLLMSAEPLSMDPEHLLKEEMQRGQLPQALLIAGPYGVGKKTLARQLAKGIMCRGTAPMKPCGICKNCRRFDRMQLPDFLIPEKKRDTKNIIIDSIRSILDALSSHPLEHGRRVVLIENAELLTPQAQNALLKSIEEPDDSTYFLFTADSLRAILPTIRSRCRIARIAPWSKERLLSALEEHGIPYDHRSRLVPLCSGSIGRALDMEADPHFWERAETVEKTFFSVQKSSDIPAALRILREKKDDAAELLNIFEMEVELLLRTGADSRPSAVPSNWADADVESLKRILNGIFEARMYRASNVVWIGAAEKLLQIITEETALW